MVFIIIAIWTKLIQQVLYDLYEWQLREYRLDRFLEMVGRAYDNFFSALFSLTIFSPFSLTLLPKITVKSTLVFFITLGIIVFGQDRFGAFFLILSLFATPILIFITILILSLPEWLMRQIVYFLASEKITRFQQKYGLKTIGIAGSYGKSTTKYFLHHLLSSSFAVITTPNSVNTPLGISRIILTKLTPQHQFFIVEMGAYKRGEIKEMCRLVQPETGIITNLASQHLALFGSMKNLITAKSELIQCLPKEGMVLINSGSIYQPVFDRKRIKKVVYFGEGKIQAKLLKTAPIVDFLKPNLEAALYLANHFNISEQNLSEQLKTLPLPPHTMTKTRGFQGSLIIDDTFNANPDGVLAALEYIDSLLYKKRLVIKNQPF